MTTVNAPFVATSEKSRVGGWIQTYTGRKFWPMDPRVGDFDITDMAYSTAKQCRFGGHILEFYSVAQHGVHTSRIVAPGFELEALLHDGHEGFYIDLPRPFKEMLPDYVRAEKRGAEVMRMQYGLPIFDEPPYMSPEVKIADDLALMTERRDFVLAAGHSWGPTLEAIQPHPDLLKPQSPRAAAASFLGRYYELVA